MQRNFRFLSIFGYSLLLGNGWVLTIIGLLVPLSNGGTAGTIWSYFIVIVGSIFATLSMAEMASMAPTAYVEIRRSVHRAS
jgi:amino acid permease